MADLEVEPAASTGKTRWGKIAAYVAGGIVCVLALFLVVAGWNMKSGNPVARVRDECQKRYGNLGPARDSECPSGLIIRHTRRSNLTEPPGKPSRQNSGERR